MNANNIKKILCDMGKALLAGIGTAAVFGVVIFLIGLPIHGFSVWGAVGEVRRWLLIIGALLLFLCAGLLLADKKSNRLQESEKWKSHFTRLGFAPAVGLAAVAVLLTAGVIDAVLFACA